MQHALGDCVDWFLSTRGTVEGCNSSARPLDTQNTEKAVSANNPSPTSQPLPSAALVAAETLSRTVVSKLHFISTP
jgi:hypothetical protein